MSKKIILIAGTPAEHSVNYSYNDDKRDFAAKTYNYATAVLKANSRISGRNIYDIEIIDYPVTRKMNNLSDEQIAKILNKSPVAIGFSVYCWNRHIFENAARSIKKADKNIIIVAGGPSVSSDPADIIRKNNCIDIAVTGDGEVIFSDLLKNDFSNLGNIRGIVFRRGNSVVCNSGKGQVDINDILSPYLADDYLPESDMVMIEPSRGCVYRCKFCSWSQNRRLNIKNKSLLADEIAWAYSKGYKKVNFSDTSVNMTDGQLKVISDALKLSKTADKISLSVFMKHDKITVTQMRMIDGLKFDEIIMGLESVNDNVLRECGKSPFDRKRFEEIVKTLGMAGSRITISIITGLPVDSYDGIRRTVNYLERLIDKYPDYINFVCSFWLAILPGTRFERNAEKYGFEYLKKGTPYLISSKYMNKKDLLRVADYILHKKEENNKFFCEEYYIEALESGL
ncbi:MAG: cobalamin-dependent protein [Deltaproteobacteria bacterium]|nr:cobalamin-dependent protein [Deltaproteobacteria bacterium]